jgi:predicted MFS family arabinose efflux permease
LALGAVCFVLGLSVPPLGPLGGSTLVGRSIRAERGRALGIMNMGAPVGALAFATLAGFTLEAWGWRDTLLLYAGIAAAINIPAAWLVPRSFEGGGPAGHDESDAGWSMARLARSPAFLLLGLVFAIAMGVGAGWSSQLAPYLDGLGLSLRSTALVVAAGGGIAVVGTLGLGALADRRSPALLLGAALGIGCLCWLAYASEASLAVAIAAALVFGIIAGGIMPLYTHLVAQRFGPASLGRALGLTNLLMLPMSAAAGPLTAAVYDATGSYRPALLGFVVAYGLAIFALVASGRWLAPDGTAR